jgi:hypothetical protein
MAPARRLSFVEVIDIVPALAALLARVIELLLQQDAAARVRVRKSGKVRRTVKTTRHRLGMRNQGIVGMETENLRSPR